MHFSTLLVGLLAALAHGRRWGPPGRDSKAVRNSDCCMICPEQFYQEASQFLEVAGGGTIDPARHSMIMSRFGRFYRHHTGADMDASLLEISRAGAGARTGAGGIAYQRYNVGCCNVCPDLFERSGSFDVALLEIEGGHLRARTDTGARADPGGGETECGGDSSLLEEAAASASTARAHVKKPCPDRKCCPVCPRQLYPPRDIIDTHNFLQVGAGQRRRRTPEGDFFASRFRETRDSRTTAHGGRGHSGSGGTRELMTTKAYKPAPLPAHGFDEGTTHIGSARSVHTPEEQDAGRGEGRGEGWGEGRGGRERGEEGSEEADVAAILASRRGEGEARRPGQPSEAAILRFKAESGTSTAAEAAAEAAIEAEAKADTSPPKWAKECCVACVERMWGQYAMSYKPKGTKPRPPEDLKNPANERSYTKPKVDNKWR